MKEITVRIHGCDQASVDLSGTRTGRFSFNGGSVFSAENKGKSTLDSELFTICAALQYILNEVPHTYRSTVTIVSDRIDALEVVDKLRAESLRETPEDQPWSKRLRDLVGEFPNLQTKYSDPCQKS